MRIAILTHSTNPRGGVVHALELGEALVRRGHDAVVHVPDPSGRGFFRPTTCPTVAIAAGRAPADTAAMVRWRGAEIERYFTEPRHRGFDVWHAQDGLSATALASLRDQTLVPAFVRTVHHVENFADPALVTLQTRAILAADRLLAVSAVWAEVLARDFNRTAVVVGNGVDTGRFSPACDTGDATLARTLVPPGPPVFLAVGGVEPRKNTLAILEAFRRLHPSEPDARLVIAGGATLLDHGGYGTRFAAALAASGLPTGAVQVTGPLPQSLMPPLYRRAEALVFPSLAEGFGLAVLEALASGIPAVVPRQPPFTGYLGPDDALWCDPADPASLAEAMAEARDPARRAALIPRGHAVAARHRWDDTAGRHLAVYQSLQEIRHA
jgi:glycosyltransferase-like protein